MAIDVDIDEALRRYDYSMCHACGITYAVRRPTGDAFTAMFDRFDENLGRLAANRERKNPLLNPAPLTEQERTALRSRLKRGVWVSEHHEVDRSEHVRQLLSDRLSNSAHVEILGSLLSIAQWNVLEIRPRFGSILAGLQRLYGAVPHALPMTDGQRLVMKEVYGIESTELIDFEAFRIPFDVRFDLVIANHMFTHALRPVTFLSEVFSHLRPGGYVYLYNEPDDAEFLDGSASMISTLNPFHMQTFDRPSFVRSLAAHGVEPLFVGHVNGGLVLLGQLTGKASPPAMRNDEREARVTAYRNARDLAILRLPESQHWRFAEEWEAVVSRAVTNGVAGFDASGRLRIVARSDRQSANADA